MKQSCCKDCLKRHDRCHQDCSDYQEFLKYKAAQKAALYEERKAETTRWQTYHKFKIERIRKKGK